MRGINLNLLSAALVLGLGACDNPAGVEGGDARMQVAAVGDDNGASRSTAGEAPSFSQALSETEGTVDFRARVYVRSDVGGWVELTGREAQRATVDASGRGAAQVFATARVNAGSYQQVRVVFEEVRANVSGGIQIGTGILNGEFRVDLQGDNQVVVERQVNATASADATTQLLINLNADAWLNQASAQSRTVSEAAFQSAVQITAQATAR